MMMIKAVPAKALFLWFVEPKKRKHKIYDFIIDIEQTPSELCHPTNYN